MRNWVSTERQRRDSTINMKMITQFPPLGIFGMNISCLRRSILISRLYRCVRSSHEARWDSSEALRIRRDETEPVSHPALAEKRRKLSDGNKTNKKVYKSSESFGRMSISSAGSDGVWDRQHFFRVSGRTSDDDESREREKQLLTRKWFHQLCNFRINFNFVCAVICLCLLPFLSRTNGRRFAFADPSDFCSSSWPNRARHYQTVRRRRPLITGWK